MKVLTQISELLHDEILDNIFNLNKIEFYWKTDNESFTYIRDILVKQ